MRHGRMTFHITLSDAADPEHVIEHNITMMLRQVFILQVDGADWEETEGDT